MREPPKPGKPMSPEEREVATVIVVILVGFALGLLFLFGIVASGTL